MLNRYLQSDPLTDLFRIQDQLLRPRVRDAGTSAPASFVPAVDVYERDDKLVFDVELPGLSPDDVEIEVDKGVLTLRGIRETDRNTEDDGGVRLERAWGQFERAFRLGDTIDPDSADADMDNGVLTIRFKKIEVQQPRRIEVRGGKTELKKAA